MQVKRQNKLKVWGFGWQLYPEYFFFQKQNSDTSAPNKNAPVVWYSFISLSCISCIFCYIEQLDAEVTKAPSDEHKARMDELNAENRQLKSAFTDAQTNLAILRSEIATLRQQYEEKRDELEW